MTTTDPDETLKAIQPGVAQSSAGPLPGDTAVLLDPAVLARIANQLLHELPEHARAADGLSLLEAAQSRAAEEPSPYETAQARGADGLSLLETCSPAVQELSKSKLPGKLARLAEARLDKISSFMSGAASTVQDSTAPDSATPGSTSPASAIRGLSPPAVTNPTTSMNQVSPEAVSKDSSSAVPSFSFLEEIRPLDSYDNERPGSVRPGSVMPGFATPDSIMPGVIPVLEPLGSQEPAAAPSTSAHNPFDLETIRRDFPILQEAVNGRRLIWLDNAATTQKPLSVIDRLSHFYKHENSNIHRAAHELAARATDAYESARESVRRFLNAADAREIVFVRGATEAINLVAQSWGKQNIGKNDEIVITWLEHHANICPGKCFVRKKAPAFVLLPWMTMDRYC